MNNGTKHNLEAQINKIHKSTRVNSYGTRDRYFEATSRFCDFLADEFRLKKFANVQEKHFVKYVEHLKKIGASSSTVQTDLSGIRYFHGRSGSRHALPENSKLDLEIRHLGREDKSWTEQEIKGAKELAKDMGRKDVSLAMSFAEKFGARIEGVCTVTVKDLKDALLWTNEVRLKEKGGKERCVPVVNNEQRQLLKECIAYAATKGRSGQVPFLSESRKHGVLNQKTSIQNWIVNHRDKFMDNSREHKSRWEPVVQKMREEFDLKPRSDKITFHGLRHYVEC
ncbi:MAG: site-specific integrase [Clostridiales bacterium]|nr:site-specific integrase [Clostridiales bacterium]